MSAKLEEPVALSMSAPPGGGFLTAPVPRAIFTRERFSEDAAVFVDAAESFWKERVLGQIDAIERKATVEVGGQTVPLGVALLREAAALGLTSMDIQEEHGGLGLDKVTSFRIAETLSGCASQAVTMGAHAGIGTLPIVYFGNDDQKRRYLPVLANAERISCYALTEPGSGSDALSGRTTARLSEDGQRYLLTGEKIYISNGAWADLAVVFARLDGLYSAFIVDLRQPGVSRGAEEQKMGIHGSSTTSLIFQDAAVPLEDRLGKPGDAAKIALNILYVGRLKLGVGDLGTAKYAIDKTIAFGRERRQFGRPVITFEMQKAKLADMVARTFALDAAIYRIAGDIDLAMQALPKGPEYDHAQVEVLRRFGVESSIAKVLGSETLMGVANHAVRMHGGYGFCREYQVERVLRDNIVDTIFEGTNDVNRMVCFGETAKAIYGGRFPFREVLAQVHEDLRAGRDVPTAAASPLAAEEVRVLALKRALGFAVERALIGVGKDLEVRQQVMSRASDAMIELYAAESALARALVMHDLGGLGLAAREALHAAVALRTYAAALEAGSALREIVTDVSRGEERLRRLAELERLLAPAVAPLEVMALRTALAEHTIDLARYPF